MVFRTMPRHQMLFLAEKGTDRSVSNPVSVYKVDLLPTCLPREKVSTQENPKGAVFSHYKNLCKHQ